MKFTLATAVHAILLAPVLANFDVYMVQDITNGVERKIYQAFGAEPSNCDEVFANDVWTSKSDVSGKNTGVRCVGSGCDYKPSPSEITVLDMNFHGTSPIYHWTITRDSELAMYGVDKLAYGRCIVFPQGNFNCVKGSTTRNGYRKFRCITTFTADDLNQF